MIFGYTLPTYTFNNLNQDIIVTVAFELIEEEPVPADLHIAIEEDVIIADDACFFTMGVIAVAGGDYVFTVQDGASATLVAGQNIRLLPGSKVESGGHLHVYISDNDPCGRPFAVVEDVEHKESMITGINSFEDAYESLLFSIYPNPTNDQFTVQLHHNEQSASTVSIRVYGLRGELVKHREVQRGQQHVFNLSGQQPGVYIVRVIKGNEVATERLIKR